MRSWLSKLLRAGLAATMVATLSVPATALADDEGAANGAVGPAAGSAAGDNEFVTIVVQLEDDGARDIALQSGEPTDDQQSRHSYYKNLVAEAAEAQAQEAAADGVDLLAQSGSGALVQDRYDYYYVIDGFAVTAPAGVLDDIQAADGVKAAFVSEELHPLESSEASDSGVSALSGDSGYANQVTLDMSGVEELDQKGDGQVIAVIDTALDVDHEAFSGDLDDSALALTESDVDALRSRLATGSDGVYVSEKIPFAYDYADSDGDVDPGDSTADLKHGTHVSGIAVANGGSTIVGTAPDAQLLFMKVARNEDGAMPNDAVLAALDDCAVLQPDVINMSLGTDGGFASEEADSAMNDAVDALASLNIVVNAAAGNSGSSAVNNQSGSNRQYATNPDSGTVASPASLASTTSVAALESAEGRTCFSYAGGTIEYIQAKTPDGYDFTAAQFSDLPAGAYTAVDCGYGTYDEVAEAARGQQFAANTIAVIKRGSADGSSITFTEKAANATQFGAAAVVIYDCTYQSLGTTPSVTEEGVAPMVLIRLADAEKLLAQSDPTIIVEGGTQISEDATTYEVTSFSSWGVTPDLELVPDIAAPGGRVYSSIPDNMYEYQNGTSMATPYLSGVTAVLKEYVESDAKFAGMTDGERYQMLDQLLISTADPQESATVEGSYYSPRQQGAGAVDAEAAVETEVYATVDGNADAATVSANLGESEAGAWAFSVTLHNLGSAAHTFQASAAALADQVEDGMFQMVSDNWTGQGISVEIGGDAADDDTVTVPAGGTATVQVSITCESAFTAWAAANTPNGTFIDGFAFFAATDGGVDLSVPYLGFYGDWSQAPVFDGMLADGDYQVQGSYVVNRVTYFPLGMNPISDDDAYAYLEGDTSVIDNDKLVISNSDEEYAPTSFAPVSGLLRGVASLTYQMVAEDGTVVTEKTVNYVQRSMYWDSFGVIMSGEGTAGAAVFDALDSDGNPLPDGAYTLTRTATTAGPTPETQAGESFTIYVDNTAPEVSDVSYSGTGQSATVSFTVTDATYLAAVAVCVPGAGEQFYYEIQGDPDETRADGTHAWHVTLSLVDVQEAWNDSDEGAAGGELPSAVSVVAVDYGLNESDETLVSTATLSGGFADVAEDAWYSETVAAAVDAGYLNGYEDVDETGAGLGTYALFGPEDSFTRGQAACVLLNMSGASAEGAASTFSDVDAGAYYAEAVGWAQAAGAVNGYPDGTYAPGQDITREEWACMLYNYAQKVDGADPKAADVEGTLAAYSDGAQVSGFAREAVAWAVEQGIMGKNPNGTVNPTDAITRAEVAAMAVDFREAFLSS